VKATVLEGGNAPEGMPGKVIRRNAVLGEHVHRHETVRNALLLQG
jgi:hypothetical protein